MAHPERKHKNIENTYLLDGQSSTLSFKCRNMKSALKAEITLNFSENMKQLHFSITFNSLK